jgi:hypothetical protein
MVRGRKASVVARVRRGRVTFVGVARGRPGAKVVKALVKAARL